jgi:hypothetical protein
MNNQSQPSFTQHPSADPTKALVSKARSPGPPTVTVELLPAPCSVTVTVTVTVYLYSGLSRRAFTPAGSRECGGKTWSDGGRKTTTATPAYLPPGGVCCRAAGKVVSPASESRVVWGRLLWGVSEVGPSISVSV